MNGRFSKLELDTGRGHPSQGAGAGQQARDAGAIGLGTTTGTAVRTPANDMAMALEAYQHGRFEPALQLYTRALQGDRSLVAAWVGQVLMLVEMREYHEGRVWANKALELFPANGDLLAAKARACSRFGDEQGAGVACDDSLKCAGTSPLRWQVRGELLLKKKAPARARDLFERSLTEPGADWFDRVLIARLYNFYGVSAAALEYAQGAVDLRPTHPYTWLTLATCQDQLGFSDRALASVARALELDPTAPEGKQAQRELMNRSTSSRFARWFGGLLRR